jgi:RNA polymerase sigma-70 factor (ECF subfamily)
MWPESSETQRIIQSAMAGDRSAPDRLFERHRAALRQMIHLRLDRALSRRVDASDIVQEVLLEASRRLPDYLKSPSLPFHVWLRQIARDHLIDAHRRHRVAQRRSLDREQPLAAQYLDRSSLDLAAQLCAAELTPAAAAIRQELERRFHAALDQLDADDREILLMRHIEQLSNLEVAQSLGLTEPAAGMRHLRAVRRLRAILGEDHLSNGPR